MGWRWCRAEAEQEIQLVDAIGDIDLVIIVTVASVQAGTGSAHEQVLEQSDHIGDIAGAISIGVTADEARWYVETDFVATTLLDVADVVLVHQCKGNQDHIPGNGSGDRYFDGPDISLLNFRSEHDHVVLDGGGAG